MNPDPLPLSPTDRGWITRAPPRPGDATPIFQAVQPNDKPTAIDHIGSTLQGLALQAPNGALVIVNQRGALRDPEYRRAFLIDQATYQVTNKGKEPYTHHSVLGGRTLVCMRLQPQAIERGAAYVLADTLQRGLPTSIEGVSIQSAGTPRAVSARVLTGDENDGEEVVQTIRSYAPVGRTQKLPELFAYAIRVLPGLQKTHVSIVVDVTSEELHDHAHKLWANPHFQSLFRTSERMRAAN